MYVCTYIVLMSRFMNVWMMEYGSTEIAYYCICWNQDDSPSCEKEKDGKDT